MNQKLTFFLFNCWSFSSFSFLNFTGNRFKTQNIMFAPPGFLFLGLAPPFPLQHWRISKLHLGSLFLPLRTILDCLMICSRRWDTNWSSNSAGSSRCSFEFASPVQPEYSGNRALCKIRAQAHLISSLGLLGRLCSQFYCFRGRSWSGWFLLDFGCGFGPTIRTDRPPASDYVLTRACQCLGTLQVDHCWKACLFANDR